MSRRINRILGVTGVLVLLALLASALPAGPGPVSGSGPDVGQGPAPNPDPTAQAAGPLGGYWKWQNPLPQGHTLWSVDFVDANTGWAVGSTILHTTDGGATWTTQDSGTINWLQSVDFVDANTGWAVGWLGTILKYTTAPPTPTPTPTPLVIYLPIVVKASSGW